MYFVTFTRVLLWLESHVFFDRPDLYHSIPPVRKRVARLSSLASLLHECHEDGLLWRRLVVSSRPLRREAAH